MAELYGVQNLEKCTLDHGIVAYVLALLGDVGEQITFRAVFDDNVGTVWGIHDLDQRDNIGMSAGLMVELDLSLLEFPLARLKTDFVKCLYCIWDASLDVHGCVHHSIGSDSKDTGELESSSKNLS